MMYHPIGCVMLVPTTGMEVTPTDSQTINDIQIKGKTHGSKQDMLFLPIAKMWQHGFHVFGTKVVRSMRMRMYIKNILKYTLLQC